MPAAFKIEGYTTTYKKVDRLYFSKQGFLAVSILSDNYPWPMPKLAIQSFQADGATPAVAFNVPTVRPPPLLRLDKLPYPALPENIPKLENTSGEEFANNEAPFPALTGPQSTYISNQVKASLDRAIEQGMIKPVPIGTPVTWCSPMLLYQKQMEPLAIPLIFNDSMHSVFEKPITLYHHSSLPRKYHLTPKSLYLIL